METVGGVVALGRALMRRSWMKTSRKVFPSAEVRLVAPWFSPEVPSASEGKATQRPSPLMTG